MPVEHRRLVIKWRRHVFVLGACFAVVFGMRIYLQRALQASKTAAAEEQATPVVESTTLPEPGPAIARP